MTLVACYYYDGECACGHELRALVPTSDHDDGNPWARVRCGECGRTCRATKLGSDFDGMRHDHGELFRPRECVVGFPEYPGTGGESA